MCSKENGKGSFFKITASSANTHTHTERFSHGSCDLIGNLTLTLVSLKAGGIRFAHLQCEDLEKTKKENRVKHQCGLVFLESYQKGAAKANCTAPHWRSTPPPVFLHGFHRFLNEEKFQTCIPSARRERERKEGCEVEVGRGGCPKIYISRPDSTVQPNNTPVSRIQSTIYRRS